MDEKIHELPEVIEMTEATEFTEVTEGDDMTGRQEMPEITQEASSGYMSSIFNTFAGGAGKKATPAAGPVAGFITAVSIDSRSWTFVFFFFNISFSRKLLNSTYSLLNLFFSNQIYLF
jgi:hypothetical protein